MKVHKLYKSIEHLYYYLENPKTELHWVNGLSSNEAGFKLLAKLYPTYKTKQAKKQKFYMGYSVYSHSHLHLVRCKTNGDRRMVLINLQKTFDIINHKILLKKMYSVGFSATQLLGFLVWVVPLFTSFQVSFKNKFPNVASTNCGGAQQSTGFSLLGESPH